jgi:hypothetical protein
MSFNNYKLTLEPKGEVLGIVRKGKKAEAVLSLSDSARSGGFELSLDNGETYQPCPNTNKERDVLYVFGQSGSGKSYYVQMYANNYKHLYPKNNIYVFSTLDSDKEGLDKIKGIKRIKLSKEFIEDEMIPTVDFKDSLVIFDDVDNISDKKLKNTVWLYLNNFLQTGRHHKISVAITFHVSAGGNATKMILNEATSLTFFPATIGGRNLKYICDSYLGMEKEQIKKLKKINSIWITVLKTYPKVILSEKEAFILKND